ncbi:MAG TPA: YicC family protein [Ignavibacteriaceae bacterium]|nr:YicC family protein [Ignavibacteriaceae bacterium]
MITSMTGYGKASSSLEGFTIEAEVKSFNNRFLEISLRIPNSLQTKEFEIKELVRNKLKRGKIQLSITIKPGEGVNTIPVNEEKLEEALEAMKRVRKFIKSKEKIRIEHFLSFKDLFTPEQFEFDEEHFEVIKETLNTALDSLIVMRQTEGKNLHEDLNNRVNLIRDSVNFIEEEFSGTITQHFEKLRVRLKHILEDVTKYNDRLDTELAILADKADITEECVRLKSHLRFFTDTLKSGEEVGRKLNFICQEMHREANTIASKSINSDIIHASVSIREEIERIREQIQNIE